MKIVYIFLIIFSFSGCSKKSETQNNSDRMNQSIVIDAQENEDLRIEPSNIENPIEAVVFSDNVNVRAEPNLDGKIVKKLNNGETIVIYDYSGSNVFRNGVWDRWYKISNTDELWINGYYIAYFPIDIFLPLIGFLPRDIDDMNELKESNIELISLMKDNVRIRQRNFAFQITNDKLVASIMDNLDIFEYDRKVGIEGKEPFNYYEIIIDDQNNKGKNLLYDIKIGDTFKTLYEKIGISEPDTNYGYEYLGFDVGESYSGEIRMLNVRFYGEKVLEKIEWQIILSY